MVEPLDHDEALVRLEGYPHTVVKIGDLSPLPKPNEIWKTKEGNYVLVVEHPMTEIEGNIGFIWWDRIDNNMNFSPVEDQLHEKTNLHIKDWGHAMLGLIGPGPW